MHWEPIHLARLDLNHDAACLVEFLERLAPFWDSEPAVIVELTDCSFLNAEGAALLTSFILRRQEWEGKTAIDWNTGTSELRRQLTRWRISELVGRNSFQWAETAIPLLHQRRLDAPAVEEYIATVVRAGQNMPAMTPELLKETNRSLCELFVNIFEHACSSSGGLAIGQYYPNKRQVQICVCDLGMGLARKVQAAGHARESPEAAIRWALEEGHSTKPGLGGLGLFLLQDFVMANGGCLRILANDGFYEQRGEKVWTERLPVAYQGTLIQIGLLIRDGEFYTLEEE